MKIYVLTYWVDATDDRDFAVIGVYADKLNAEKERQALENAETGFGKSYHVEEFDLI